MKLSIKVTDRGTQMILRSIGEGMTNAFKNAVEEEMEGMAKYARDYLEEASRRGTGKKYWTGTLQSAIKSRVIESSGNKIEGVVGVDATVTAETRLGHREVVEYDVIVEKEGWGSRGPYRYMENAYMALAPGMDDRIAKRLGGLLLKVTKTPWGFRDIKTGRWTSPS